MKIALSTTYSVYEKDRLFCESACTIGENLLLPTIMLKQRLEEMGHEVHTIDMYKPGEVGAVLFQEIPVDSILTVQSVLDLAKYILRGNWKKDFLLRTVLTIPKAHRALLILEPPVVAPRSHNKRFHKYFNRVLTWHDALTNVPQYQKIYFPQYVPNEKYDVPFAEKKPFVIIAGNKSSKHPQELYSARKQVIRFFEDKQGVFDLFGFGWEKENFSNYRGSVDRKLQKLSQYKYCICYENMRDIEGYITEKLFDCFFAGCVPIYWGASNVSDFIPEDIFIDMRKFNSIEEMYTYVSDITQEEYDGYIERIRKYLESECFKNNFSVEQYINTIIESLV